MVDAYICYKESLRGTTPGLAVFEPVSDDLKAGHCGYFDYLGQWTNIRDLNSITENDTLYKPLSRRVPMSDNGGARTEWSPIFGLGVQVAQGTIQGNAQAPGVNVKGTMTLESTKENAAILMADPVAYCRCEEDQPLKDWLKENEEILMDDPNHRDNILRHGLCIITGVYRTRRCTVGQWRGRGAEVSIELDVGVFNQKGQITGGGSWKKIAGGGYWKAYGFDTANPKNMTVVVQGIKYSPNWFIKLLQRMYDNLRAVYRGSSTYLISENDDVNENVHALGDDSDGERDRACDKGDLEDISKLK